VLYVLSSAEKDERIFPKGNKILLVYASQTGTAEAIARDLLKNNEVLCDCIAMCDLSPVSLEDYGRQLFIVSTHGEGAPPSGAGDFFDALKAAQPNLRQVEFAVLALGSRSYPRFCQFGRDLYAELAAAGALPRMLTVEVHNNNTAAVVHWRKIVAQTFGLAQDLDADWDTATVMEATTDGAAENSVTLYVQSLERECVNSLLVKAPGRRQQAVEFAVIPEPDSPFTRLRLDGNSKVAKALAQACSGDKWLVKAR
jgi:sulfite reductase alpha subunit-like flavoprotein